MTYNATLRVWRGDEAGGGLQDFTVEVNEGEVVLDIIHRLQQTQTPDLAVRWNCKAGKCGSCSAEVNGKPRLMCMTRMSTFAEDEGLTLVATCADLEAAGVAHQGGFARISLGLFSALEGVGLTAELDVLAFGRAHAHRSDARPGRARRPARRHCDVRLTAPYIAAWPPSMFAAALRTQLNAAAFLLWRSPRPLGNHSASTARPARASPSPS